MDSDSSDEDEVPVVHMSSPEPPSPDPVLAPVASAPPVVEKPAKMSRRPSRQRPSRRSSRQTDPLLADAGTIQGPWLKKPVARRGWAPTPVQPDVRAELQKKWLRQQHGNPMTFSNMSGSKDLDALGISNVSPVLREVEADTQTDVVQPRKHTVDIDDVIDGRDVKLSKVDPARFVKIMPENKAWTFRLKDISPAYYVATLSVAFIMTFQRDVIQYYLNELGSMLFSFLTVVAIGGGVAALILLAVRVTTSNTLFSILGGERAEITEKPKSKPKDRHDPLSSEPGSEYEYSEPLRKGSSYRSEGDLRYAQYPGLKERSFSTSGVPQSPAPMKPWGQLPSLSGQFSPHAAVPPRPGWNARHSKSFAGPYTIDPSLRAAYARPEPQQAPPVKIPITGNYPEYPLPVTRQPNSNGYEMYPDPYEAMTNMNDQPGFPDYYMNTAPVHQVIAADKRTQFSNPVKLVFQRREGGQEAPIDDSPVLESPEEVKPSPYLDEFACKPYGRPPRRYVGVNV